MHPDGKRLATCGGDSNIKIWNIEPISDEIMEDDADDTSNKRTTTPTPKLLYSINYAHSKSINSIKWSKDGRYLASVSDDRECIVWTLSPFQSANTPEIWTSIVCLKGHSADITDVIWSADNQFLATCSLDKTILIWETTKFGIYIFYTIYLFIFIYNSCYSNFFFIYFRNYKKVRKTRKVYKWNYMGSNG